MRGRPASPASGRSFEAFQASALYCTRCRGPQPVRERLLLVLPDGDLYEYLCAACGASLGKRKVQVASPVLIGC